MSKEFMELRHTDLIVDHRAQRDLDQKRANAIGKAFDPALMGVPVVSKRPGGKYAIMDAQHRVAGAKVANFNDPFMCEVHTGLTLQQEAEMFLRLNGGRSAPTPFSKYRVGLTAQEAPTVAIERMLCLLSLRVVKSRAATGGIRAVGELYTAYHHGTLQAILTVLTSWSPKPTEAAYLDANLFRALTAFFDVYPQVRVRDLLEKLSKKTPAFVVRKIQGIRMSYPEMTPAQAACGVLREIYNERRPRDRRLPLPPPVQ